MRYWQAFFKGEAVPEEAPEYIHRASQLSQFENLSQEERKMAEQLSKAEAIRRAEREYDRRLGSQLTRYQIVRDLNESNFPLETIAGVINLSVEEIKKIIAMDKEDLTYEKLDANNYLRPID